MRERAYLLLYERREPVATEPRADGFVKKEEAQSQRSSGISPKKKSSGDRFREVIVEHSVASYRSSPEEFADGGHRFGLPSSSTTRDLEPGGKTCRDFRN